MEKLPMCRICLVENVRMYVVVNKELHELYERLTKIPFVTEDSRPMLVCFLCCAKLKQCCQFLRKCLEAEELFGQMMKEEHEPDPLLYPEHSKFFNGFINSPIVHISIFDDGQTEELRVSESIYNIIDPEEEHPTDTEKSELETFNNNDLDVEYILAHHSESDTEDDVLFDIKTKVEDKQETKGEPNVKTPIHNAPRTTLKDAVPTEQRENEHYRILSRVSKIIKINQNKRMTKFKEPFTKPEDGVSNSINDTAISTNYRYYSYRDDIKRDQKVCVKEKRFKCDICQRSIGRKWDLLRHMRTHTGDYCFRCDICQRGFNRKSHLTTHTYTHTGDKPFKCDICQRSFSQKSLLTRHSRVHTGEKPYNCDICQRSFFRRFCFNNHTCKQAVEKNQM